MMSLTAIATSSLPVQALQCRPLNQAQQSAVPVLLATAVPATSTEPEQLIQYRITKGIEIGSPVGLCPIKWPEAL